MFTLGLILVFLSLSMVYADDTGMNPFSFSDNYYAAGLQANENGIFPVVLNVDTELEDISALEIEAYDWKKSNEPVSSWTLPSSEHIVLSGDMSPSKPGEIWSYRARFVLSDGSRTEWSDFDYGYGAITNEAFIKFYERYAMKPWEFVSYGDFPSSLKDKWNRSAIKKKIDAHGLSSLGNITESSDFHDGLVNYHSKASGFSGNIYFHYENFGELDVIWATGNFSMYGVSLSGNGKRCDGNVTVFGIYPAEIDFSGIKVVDYKPSGTYLVRQQSYGGTEVKVKASAN